MKIISIFFCLLILISSVNVAVSSEPEPVDEPIIIYCFEGDEPLPTVFAVYTVEDLRAVDYQPSNIEYIELMNDLEIMDSSWWKPIGKANKPFTREFNGNNHTITFKGDMELVPSVGSENSGCGLFGYVYNGQINDLNVIFQGNLTSFENNTGVLVGILDGNHAYDSPAIVNCHVSNDGYSVSLHSISQYSVSGKNNVGGLVGYVINGTIENSSSDCLVTASGNNAGGLVGLVSRGTLINSSASGSVRAVENVGGFIGYISNQTTISNSFADSSVKSAGKFGNFIGNWDENYKPDVVNSFYKEKEVDLESVPPNVPSPSICYDRKPLQYLVVGIGIILLIAVVGIFYFKKKKVKD